MRGDKGDGAAPSGEADDFFVAADLPPPASPDVREALHAVLEFAAGGREAHALKDLARLSRLHDLALPDALAGFLHERTGAADAAARVWAWSR